MFSLFSQKNLLGVEKQIHRLCQLIKSDQATTSDARLDVRHRRCVPVVILPWTARRPAVDLLISCSTYDLADQGISLISPRKLKDSTILIGFWGGDGSLEEPWFFRAEVKSVEPIEAGFWRYGTHVHEFMNQQHRELVVPLFQDTKERLNSDEATVLSPG